MRISITAWKTDICTLTWILRLRLSPSPLPYPLIASKFLSHMPQNIYLLQKHTIPRPEKLKPGFYEGMRERVERYLEERFEVAKRWENESWVMAWELEYAAVEEIVRLMGLEGEGYGVWGEMEIQREWRRSGDWRAGSTPCFCGKDDGVGMFGAVGCEREEALRGLRGLRAGAVGGERDEVEEEERVEEVMVGGDTAEVVDEQRDLEEKVKEVSSEGEEKVLVAEEVAPPPLKDVLDRIRYQEC
jgi:hypothetical protein